MKLYKFRSLAGNTECEIKSKSKPKPNHKSDYCRVIDIIKTGEFWCSYFWELNDPMEGLFYANPDSIKKICNEKEKYKICSFSGFNGFKNPLLWGYYANGFKGVVIEIEVENRNNNIEDRQFPINDYKKIYQVKYISYISSMLNSRNDVKKILIRKLDTWKHEDEFRFLVKDDSDTQKIGTITKVFFGDPYGDVTNSKDLEKKGIIKDYINKKKELIELLENERIGYKDVKIYDNGIYVDVK